MEKFQFEKNMGISDEEIIIVEILDKKLEKANIDPSDELTEEDVKRVEELTVEAKEEAKKLLK